MVSRETEGGAPSPPSGVGVTSCVGVLLTLPWADRLVVRECLLLGMTHD